MNEWYNYFLELAHRLLQYIQDETSDALYYEQLAHFAPNREAGELLHQFSRDEARHAANLRKVYQQITGEKARIPPVSPPEIPMYQRAIQQRILAESNDFVKYGNEFLTAPDMYLRNLFYTTGATEARHGMSLSTLLCTDEKKNADP